MKNYIILFFALALILLGCKKYEEGPALSLRSEENRLLGLKQIEKYTVDGVDSTSSIFLFQHHECSGKMFFSRTESLNPDQYALPNCLPFGWDGKGGWWDFVDGENKKLAFYTSIYRFDENDSLIVKSFGGNFTWDIMKLTKKELWLQRKDGKYELKFECVKT